MYDFCLSGYRQKIFNDEKFPIYGTSREKRDGGVTARTCAKPSPHSHHRCCCACRSTAHSTRTRAKHSRLRSAYRGSLAILSLHCFPAWYSAAVPFYFIILPAPFSDPFLTLLHAFNMCRCARAADCKLTPVAHAGGRGHVMEAK